jgi:hypothetical protein
MPTIPGLDKDKCRQRNRIAARRGGIEATPVRFLKATELSSVDLRRTHRLGDLPKNDEEAMARINASLPDGATPLAADDVYIHYVEAANSNFISDRFAFLATSTLKNIAAGAEAGIAFMNSHRTGGYSTPSELPFGKSFAGAYERDNTAGTVTERALIGFYMLRGIQPNGSNGPSTDDLHRMIDGGSLFDVSVGLRPGPMGQVICDVCGNDYGSYDDCSHLAGTHRGMSEEDIAAQQALGVPGGQCTYRLENWDINEVSGVYDGAVPGAGFSKAFNLLDQLSDEDRAEFRAAFRELMDDEEVPPTGKASTGRSAGATRNPSTQKISPSGGSTGPVGAGTNLPETGKGAMNPMEKWKEKLVRALKAVGLNSIATAVFLDSSEDPAELAQTMAKEVDKQVDEKLQAHPLMGSCKLNNINTGEDLTAVLDRAKLGDRYFSKLKEDAVKEAIRAYGPDFSSIAETQVKNLGVVAVEELHASWQKMANEKYRIDGATPGEGASRQTQPTANAADAPPANGTPKSNWEKLTEEAESPWIEDGLQGTRAPGGIRSKCACFHRR